MRGGDEPPHAVGGAVDPEPQRGTEPLDQLAGGRPRDQGQGGRRRQLEGLAQRRLDRGRRGPDPRGARPRSRGGRAGGSAPAGARGPRRPRTTRPASASIASACSGARYRAAVSSWSKSRNATASADATRCRTASVPTTTRVPGSPCCEAPVTSPTGSPASASSSSRARATPTRRLRNRVDPHALQTTGRSVPQRRQRSTPASSCSTDAAHTSQRPELAARRAGQEPGPADPVDDADHPAGSAQEVDEAIGEQAALRGIVVAPVHHLDRGPAPPLLGPARDEEVAPVEGFERRARRHQEARPAGPLGPLAGDVAGVPGRGLLGLVALVVLVQHHHPAEPGHRCPGAGAGADHRHPAGRRPGPLAGGRRAGPVVGEAGDRVAGAGEAGRQPLGLGHRRAQHERVTVRVGGGREHRAGTGRPRAPAAARRGGGAGRRPGAGRPAARRGRVRVAGGSGRARTAPGGDAVRRNEAGRPAQRHAAQRARSTSSAGGPQPVTLASGRRSIPSRGATSASTTHAPTRRPCSSTRTIVPTRTRSSQPSGTL